MNPSTMNAPASAPRTKPRLALCFTGGKDSTLTLHLLLHRPDLLLSALRLEAATAPGCPPPGLDLAPLRDPAVRARAGLPADLGDGDAVAAIPTRTGPWPAADLPYELVTLVTFAPPSPNFLSHPVPAIAAQADAMGLPHVLAEVRGPDYAASYAAAMARLHVDILVTGDMMDVCSGFMARAAMAAGVHLWCPLWNIDRELAWDLLVGAMGIHPVLTCVHVRRFLQSWGRADEAEAEAAPGVSAADEDEVEASPATLAAGAEADIEDAADSAASSSLSPSSSPTATAAAPVCSAAAAVLPLRKKRSAADLRSPSPAAAATSSDAASESTASPSAGRGPPPRQRRRLVSPPVAAAKPSADDTAAQLARALARAHTHVGRTLDRAALDDWLYPAADLDGVDLCGELGEFHTMVVDGPLFVRGRVDLTRTPPDVTPRAEGAKTAVDPSGEYVYLVITHPAVVPLDA
ncbi:hypothetical protein H9P43_005895 [Blastocladiella emersonii ATCC 22665]|nr:hypothetical protein H9P43_005895 [Blastocladiella emersonii ATCC 22665]